MTFQRLLTTLVLLLGAIAWPAAAGAAQSGTADQYAGTYTGTWEGPGSGNFELTVAKGKDGAAGGKVAVTTDGGNYDAELRALAFDGNKMTAKYDYPLDQSAEVIISGTFDGATARGTWSLRAKGQTDEVAGGTWTTAKK